MAGVRLNHGRSMNQLHRLLLTITVGSRTILGFLMSTNCAEMKCIEILAALGKVRIQPDESIKNRFLNYIYRIYIHTVIFIRLSDIRTNIKNFEEMSRNLSERPQL